MPEPRDPLGGLSVWFGFRIRKRRVVCSGPSAHASTIRSYIVSLSKFQLESPALFAGTYSSLGTAISLLHSCFELPALPVLVKLSSVAISFLDQVSSEDAGLCDKLSDTLCSDEIVVPERRTSDICGDCVDPERGFYGRPY